MKKLHLHEKDDIKPFIKHLSINTLRNRTRNPDAVNIGTCKREDIFVTLQLKIYVNMAKEKAFEHSLPQCHAIEINSN